MCSVKNSSWLWLALAGGAGVAGFVVGRQVTQNNVTRLTALKNELELEAARKAAAIRQGVVLP
jgi:uncharacterized protein HemX